MFEDFGNSQVINIVNEIHVSIMYQNCHKNPCDALIEYPIGSVYGMCTVYPHLPACLYFVQRQNVAKYTVPPNGSVIGYTISLSVFVRSLKSAKRLGSLPKWSQWRPVVCRSFDSVGSRDCIYSEVGHPSSSMVVNGPSCCHPKKKPEEMNGFLEVKKWPFI